MDTKTRLLERLTVDQLREIAAAEVIRLQPESSKDQIIKRLLALSLFQIRKYAEGFGQSGQAGEQIARQGTRVKMRKKRNEDARIGIPEDLGKLIRDRIAGGEFDPDKIDAMIKQSLPQLERIKGFEKLTGPYLGNVKDFIKASFETALAAMEKKKEDANLKPTFPVSEATPEILPSRVATGYGTLDRLLFGGLPEKYAVMLTSPSSDERELIIRRFIETGVGSKQTTFHVTRGPGYARSLAREFSSSFYLFLCNPQSDTMIENLPNVFKLKGVENLNDISIALAAPLKKLSEAGSTPRRACIEVVSDVLLQHNLVQTRRWLTVTKADLTSRGFTILATMDADMHSRQDYSAVLDIFEGEIALYNKEGQEEPQKYIRIKKLLNQKYSPREVPVIKSQLENS